MVLNFLYYNICQCLFLFYLELKKFHLGLPLDSSVSVKNVTRVDGDLADEFWKARHDLHLVLSTAGFHVPLLASINRVPSADYWPRMGGGEKDEKSLRLRHENCGMLVIEVDMVDEVESSHPKPLKAINVHK